MHALAKRSLDCDIRFSLVLATLVFLAASAGAGDGIVEINQAAAERGGVTATDTPGFPVTLDRPGSYRLTGELLLSGPSSLDQRAIEVTADDVAIDLGGFAILGANPPLSCGGNSGRGISAVGRSRIAVRNGFVRRMGEVSIYLGSHSTIEGLIVLSSGSAGIVCESGCRVRGTLSQGNCGAGVVLLDGSTVEESVASSSREGSGIVSFGAGTAVVATLAIGNFGFGVEIDPAGSTGVLANSFLQLNGQGSGAAQFTGPWVSYARSACSGVPCL